MWTIKTSYIPHCTIIISMHFANGLWTYQVEYRLGQRYKVQLVWKLCELLPFVQSFPMDDILVSIQRWPFDAESQWLAGWCCLSYNCTCWQKLVREWYIILASSHYDICYSVLYCTQYTKTSPFTVSHWSCRATL